MGKTLFEFFEGLEPLSFGGVGVCRCLMLSWNFLKPSPILPYLAKRLALRPALCGRSSTFDSVGAVRLGRDVGGMPGEVASFFSSLEGSTKKLPSRGFSTRAMLPLVSEPTLSAEHPTTVGFVCPSLDS